MLNLNSGLFSERSLEDINECTYDPPYVGKGSAPGWAAGSSKQVEQITDGIPDYSAPASDDYGGYGDDYAYDYRRRRSAGRQKRFDMGAYGKIIICFLEKDVNLCVKAVVIIMAIPTEQVIHMVTAMTTTVVLTIQLFLNVLLMIPLVATMLMLGLKHPVSSKIIFLHV